MIPKSAIQIKRAMEEQNDWLEDVLAGLLINGVLQSEIDVQYHPKCRVVVVVRGEKKYEHAVKYL